MSITRQLVHHKHVRLFVVETDPDGWAVREEKDNHVVRSIHRDDWHRVERDTLLFELKARALKRAGWKAVVFAAALAGAWGPSLARAQTPQTGISGAGTFQTYCATCHGRSAKGDGPMASVLNTRPADLTQIARRNGGTFPADQVARTIDGRKPVTGHRSGDMPAWGEVFAKTADPTPVEDKIKRLVVYLDTIQEKP